MAADRRHQTSESETKNFIKHSKSNSTFLMITPAPPSMGLVQEVLELVQRDSYEDRDCSAVEELWVSENLHFS
jgi:hypothetical protein